MKVNYPFPPVSLGLGYQLTGSASSLLVSLCGYSTWAFAGGNDVWCLCHWTPRTSIVHFLHLVDYRGWLSLRSPSHSLFSSLVWGKGLGFRTFPYVKHSKRKKKLQCFLEGLGFKFRRSMVRIQPSMLTLLANPWPKLWPKLKP